MSVRCVKARLLWESSDLYGVLKSTTNFHRIKYKFLFYHVIIEYNFFNEEDDYKRYLNDKIDKIVNFVRERLAPLLKGINFDGHGRAHG